ncbi:Nicotinate dehydrogenase FAD-subunit [Pelotomaculum sp. FP]|uniref:FAD binding domain-containing protein n=1 Tax=Pelotomaculum sp. FP TaxID=261474 RepID=UPI0010670AD5|nr:xanthine dehydrogenase family protein subunit M [Pelotomaculum sp. FP]TEB18040.1 Nicotinate dehydrogenase FAD-subunit [Pelotomaculum sp. FP]
MSIASIPHFEYHVPKTLEEVLTLLDNYRDEARIIAGGTDVIPKLKGGVLKPKHVISLKEVRGLKYIDWDCDTGLRFGAKTPIRVIENNSIVKSQYRALYEGAHSIASTQVRNIGTIVGNICNAVPSADSAPALLVLGAKIKILSSNGVRIVPIEEFFTGVCQTVVASNELVTEVQIPAMEKNADSFYYKTSIRRALDLALVGVAAKLVVEDGICKDAKIALGAVAITPKRAFGGEEMLIGKVLTDDLINTVANYVSQNECRPITDIRATADYRRNLVRLLTRDAIKQAAAHL